MKKNRRKNRTILSLLLAAMLAVEPAGAAMTVRAEENTEIAVSSEAESGEEQDNGIGDVPATGDGQESQNTGNASETEEGQEGQTGNAENTDRTENEGSDSSNAGAGTGTDSENAGDDGGETDTDNTGGNEGVGSEEGEDSEGTGSDDDGETDGEEDAEDLDETAEEENVEDVETVDGEEDTEDPEKETDKLTDGFTPMSSDYRLTTEQMENKRDLAAHLDEIGGYEEGVDYVKGQVITFADTWEEAERIAEAYHAQIVKYGYGVLTLELSGEGNNVTKAMRAAANAEINLPAVWPNYYRYAYGEIVEDETARLDDNSKKMPEPDDSIEIEIEEYEAEGYGEAYGTGDIEQENSYLDALAYSDPYLKPDSDYYQYHHAIIGSPYAWAVGYTGQGIKVAVLDTGVADHTDVSATSIFGPGTSDSYGHGTHVAGIIGAKANGRLGAGVAPDVMIYSGNVLPNGTGTDDDIIQAIKAAQVENVDIINMSLGGLGYNGAFQQTVDEACEQGIAMFAASGNDGGQNYTYPSCYDHVISVAATDTGNGRAYFSNYGDKIDLSAPGVSISSASTEVDADDGSRNSYRYDSGTSMACPVAAGEAAVILSGNDDLRSMTGKERVDALETLMKANALNVGSGMGAGIPSLPKALNLNTAAAKPTTPTIQFAPDNTKVAQTVKASIRAQGGVTIYYTTDGKTPTYKNGLVGNGAVQYTAPFDINNRAKATVKAIAVNDNGVTSSVRSASYTLKPYVNSIAISGIQQIAKGKSAQMQVTVLPAYATNKKVTWEIYTSEGKKIDAKLAKETGVSISTGGKVTVSKKAVIGGYIVKAIAKDSSGTESEPHSIQVTDTVKIDSVKFTTKSVTLVLPTDSSYDLGQKLDGKCKDGNAAVISDFRWSSSNTAVAVVDASGIVTPLKAGKVTITALANDSSGKKATCTITIKQLADEITISGNDKVAAGKSQTYKATVMPSYTTNKKVTWELYELSDDDSKQEVKVTAQRGKEIGVSINSSTGKLTTNSKAVAGTYTIKVIAADGSGKSASKSIEVKKGIITGITFENNAYKKVSIFRKQQVAGTKTTATVYALIKGTDGADLTAYEVVSSNPGIASVTREQSEEEGKITLAIRATGKAAGKTNITIAATDGSNKKLTCAVTVNNPVSGITVAPTGGNSQYVAKGKSLQLKAVVETDSGKVSNKGVTWELRDTKGVLVDEKKTGMKISSTGKVTAAENAPSGTYNVWAIAKDGSGVARTYAVSVAAPATYISLRGVDGNTMYSSGIYPLTKEKFVSPKKLATVYSDKKQGSITVTSSNPKVMSASIENGSLLIVTEESGSATLTLKATDGSGKQVKYNFKVR